MAYLYRLIVILIIALPNSGNAQSAPVGAIDLSGWIKSTDGVWSRAFADGNGTRATPTNTAVNSTSTALVQTSKGLQSFDIQKTSTVDLNRIGGAVAKFAKLVGPVGMAIGTVSLICELSNICNVDGIWQASGTDPMPGQPNSYPATDGKWWGWDTTYYATVQAACSDTARITVNAGATGFVFDHSQQVNATTYQCFVRRTSDGAIFGASNTYLNPGCANGYTQNGSTCEKNGVTTSHPATDNDWNTKQPLLNDQRFVPELNEKGEDIPTGIPTLTPGQKKQLGLDSVPTKDSSGNITGREDTTTEIEAVDAGTSDNPGRVIIKETKTTIKYDTNNTQISSTTNTSYSSQPQEKEPPQYTISFDSVPEATLPSYNVPNTFSSDSWGSGNCPPNIDVSLTNHSFTIPTQPVCDTAEMINPFTLLLASIISVYIIAGVRGGSAT